MVDKKRTYMDRTYLYYTLYKTPIKREGKRLFLIKKNPIINGARQEYIQKKVKTIARVRLLCGRLLHKGMVPRSGKILLEELYPNKILVDGKEVNLRQKNKNFGL